MVYYCGSVVLCGYLITFCELVCVRVVELKMHRVLYTESYSYVYCTVLSAAGLSLSIKKIKHNCKLIIKHTAEKFLIYLYSDANKI